MILKRRVRGRNKQGGKLKEEKVNMNEKGNKTTISKSLDCFVNSLLTAAWTYLHCIIQVWSLNNWKIISKELFFRLILLSLSQGYSPSYPKIMFSLNITLEEEREMLLLLLWNSRTEFR